MTFSSFLERADEKMDKKPEDTHDNNSKVITRISAQQRRRYEQCADCNLYV